MNLVIHKQIFVQRLPGQPGTAALNFRQALNNKLLVHNKSHSKCADRRFDELRQMEPCVQRLRHMLHRELCRLLPVSNNDNCSRTTRANIFQWAGAAREDMSRSLTWSRARISSLRRFHELNALKFHSQYCFPDASLVPTQPGIPRQLHISLPRSRHTYSSNQTSTCVSSGFVTRDRTLNPECQSLSYELRSSPSDSVRKGGWRVGSATGYGTLSQSCSLPQGHRVQELSSVPSHGQEKETEEDEGDTGVALLKDRAESLLTSVTHPKDLLDAESNRYLILRYRNQPTDQTEQTDHT